MIEEFIKYLSLNRGYSAGTCIGYKKDLVAFVRHLREASAEARWSNIGREDVESWVTKMSQEGLKPATIKRRVSAIRSLYTYMRGKGLIETNPAAYVSTPKKANTVPEVLRNETLKETLYDSSIELETRAMIAIMAETGIRTAELLSLRPGDADLTNRTLRIEGKGNKQRIVYFGEWTAAYLQNREVRNRERLFRIEDRDARYRIHSALSKHSHNDHCTPHVIRHTFASAMLNNGAGLMTVSRLLGHEHVATTERYTRVAMETIKTEYQSAKPILTN